MNDEQNHPVEPGSPEWQQRVADYLQQEQGQPERWWYMSFADETGFRGGIVTKASGWTSAVQKTHRLGINPGGEVQFMEIPEDFTVPPGYEDRILTKEDLDAWQ